MSAAVYALSLFLLVDSSCLNSLTFFFLHTTAQCSFFLQLLHSACFAGHAANACCGVRPHLLHFLIVVSPFIRPPCFIVSLPRRLVLCLVNAIYLSISVCRIFVASYYDLLYYLVSLTSFCDGLFQR